MLHYDSNKQDSLTIANIYVSTLDRCSHAWPQLLQMCVCYVCVSRAHKVLREYRSCKHWEERLYINEDFKQETMEIRKKLFKQTKELRKKKKFAKVIHNRLISFNTRQNPWQFDVGNEEQEAS